MNESSAPDPSRTDLAPPRADAVGSELDPPSAEATGAGADHEPINVDERDVEAIDLDVIERDLTDVQTALERLDEGTYWTDEITGEPIDDEMLAAHPTARTATPTLG